MLPTSLTHVNREPEGPSLPKTTSSAQGAPQEQKSLRDRLREAHQKKRFKARPPGPAGASGSGPPPPAAAAQPHAAPAEGREQATAPDLPPASINAGGPQPGGTAAVGSAAAARVPRPGINAHEDVLQPEQAPCGAGRLTSDPVEVAASPPGGAPSSQAAVPDRPRGGADGNDGSDGNGEHLACADGVAAPVGASALVVPGRADGGYDVIRAPLPAQAPMAAAAAPMPPPPVADTAEESRKSPAGRRAVGERTSASAAAATEAAVAGAAVGPDPPAGAAAPAVAAAAGGSVPAAEGFVPRAPSATCLPPPQQQQQQYRQQSYADGGGGSAQAGFGAASAGVQPGGGSAAADGGGAGGQAVPARLPRPYTFTFEATKWTLEKGVLCLPFDAIQKKGLRGAEDLGPISVRGMEPEKCFLWCGGEEYVFTIWTRPPQQQQQQQGEQQQEDEQPGDAAAGRVPQGRGGGGGAAAAGAAASWQALICVAKQVFAEAKAQVGDKVCFKRLADASYRLTITALDGKVRTPVRGAAAVGGGGDVPTGNAAAAPAAAAGGGRQNRSALGAGGDAPAADAVTARVGSSAEPGAPVGSGGAGGVVPSERTSVETAGDASTTDGGTERRRASGPCSTGVGGRGAEENRTAGPSSRDGADGAEVEVDGARRSLEARGADGAAAAGGASSMDGAEGKKDKKATRGSVPPKRGAAAPIEAAAAAEGGAAPTTTAAAEATAATAAAASPPVKKSPGKKSPAKAGGSSGGRPSARQAPAPAAADPSAPTQAAAAAGAAAQGAGPGPRTGPDGARPQAGAAAARSGRRTATAEPTDNACCKILTRYVWTKSKLYLNKDLTEQGAVFHGLPAGQVVLLEKSGTRRWTVRLTLPGENAPKSARHLNISKEILTGLGLGKADCEGGCVELRFERVDVAAAEAAARGAAGSGRAPTRGAAAAEKPVAAFTVEVGRRPAPGQTQSPAAEAEADAEAEAEAETGVEEAAQPPPPQPQNKQKWKPREAAPPPGAAAAAPADAAAGGSVGGAAGEPAADDELEETQVPMLEDPGLAFPHTESYRAAISGLTRAHLCRSYWSPQPAAGAASAPAAESRLGGDGGVQPAAAELKLFDVVFPAGPVAARARAGAASWQARAGTAAAAGGGSTGSSSGEWEIPGLDAQGRTRKGWSRRPWHQIFSPAESGSRRATDRAERGVEAGQAEGSAPLSVTALLEGLRSLVAEQRQRQGRHEVTDKDAHGSAAASGAGGPAAAPPPPLPTGPLHLGCLRPCLDEERGGLGVCTWEPIAAGTPLGVLGGFVLEGRRSGPWDGVGAQEEDYASDAAMYVREGLGSIQDEGLLEELRRRGNESPYNAWQFAASSYLFPYPEELTGAAALWRDGGRGQARNRGGGPHGRPQQAQQQPAQPHVLCMLGYGNVLSLLNDARPMTLELAQREGLEAGTDAGEPTSQANCVVVPAAYRGVVVLVVVALRALAAGEQLLANYGHGWWQELAAVWELVAADDLNPQDLLHGAVTLQAFSPPSQRQQQQPVAAAVAAAAPRQDPQQPRPLASAGGVGGATGDTPVRVEEQQRVSSQQASPLPSPRQQQRQEQQQLRAAPPGDLQRPDARSEGAGAADKGRGHGKDQGRGSQSTRRQEPRGPEEGPDRKGRRSPSPARPKGDRAPDQEAEQDRRRGRDGDGKRPRSRSPGHRPPGHRSPGHRDRDRERERNRERDKDRDRDRERDRERDRDRDRQRERDHERDRERDRERGKDRNNPSELRSRSTSRDREGGGREARDRDRDRDRGRDGRSRDHRDRDPRDRGRESSRDRITDKPGRPDSERGHDRDRERDRHGDRARDRHWDRHREQERRKAPEPGGRSSGRLGSAEPAATGAVASKRVRVEGADRAVARVLSSAGGSVEASTGAGAAAAAGAADFPGDQATGAAPPLRRASSQQPAPGQPGAQQQPTQQPQQPPSLGPTGATGEPGYSPLNTPKSGAAGGAACSAFAVPRAAPACAAAAPVAAAAAGVPNPLPPQSLPGVRMAEAGLCPPIGSLLPDSASGTLTSTVTANARLPPPPPLGPPAHDRKRRRSRERAATAVATEDLLPGSGSCPPPPAPVPTRGQEPGQRQAPDAAGWGSRLGQQPPTQLVRQGSVSGEGGGRPPMQRRRPREEQPLPGGGSPLQRSARTAAAAAAAAAAALDGAGGMVTEAMAAAPVYEGFEAEPDGREERPASSGQRHEASGSTARGAAPEAGVRSGAGSDGGGGAARHGGGAARRGSGYDPFGDPYRSQPHETDRPVPLPDLGFEEVLLRRMKEVARRPQPMLPAPPGAADTGAAAEASAEGESLDEWVRRYRLQRLRREADELIKQGKGRPATWPWGNQA